MADIGIPQQTASKRRSWGAWRNALVASKGFQSWAARFPITRSIVRREGEDLFDLVSGFVQSQVLKALIDLRVLHHLMADPLTAEAVATRLNLPPDRALILLNAGVALNLLEKRSGGYLTSRRGAALTGVPGLEAMIGHHDVLYRDLSDPTAFFRGDTQTELAEFWPYVFGGGAAGDPAITARYSQLMADSQGLVAEETLRSVDLTGSEHLVDVGGGSGVFLSHVAAKYPGIALTLFDLPAVMPSAQQRLADQSLSERVALVPGSFRTDPLPQCDAASLIRVLYDHRDDTVMALLAALFEAITPGGRLIVSEPMTGGAAPHCPGDVYFAIYCLAMQTGTARSPERIAEMMSAAGFRNAHIHPSARPFITTTIDAYR